MSRLILLANFIASWDPDQSQRPRRTEYIRNTLGVEAVLELPNGWVLGIKPLPRTTATDVFFAPDNLVILHGPRTMSASGESADTELRAMAAQIRNRPDELGHHAGDFAIAVLGADGEYGLVASPVALPPLYYSHDGEIVTLASRLDWIAAIRPAPIVLDRLAVALWSITAPMFLSGRTVLEGIRRLRRGTTRRFRRHAAAQEVDLTVAFLGEPGAEPDASKSEVACELRRYILDALETELVPNGLNLLSLSGGTDSSSLAILARRMGVPFKAVSLIPTAAPDRDHELRYISEALGERYPGDWIEIPWLHKEYRQEVLPEAPPILHPVTHPVLCKLASIRRDDPVEAYFGGEFCDGLIGGGPTVYDWSIDTSLLMAWGKAPIQMPGATFTFARYLTQRLRAAVLRERADHPRRLPEFFTDSLRQEYEAWLQSTSQERPHSGAGAMLHRWYHTYSLWVDMNWEAASQLDVRRSFPFIGRNVLSLLWRTPTHLRLGPGSKELVRLALDQDVSPQVLNRPEKGRWGERLPFRSSSARIPDIRVLLDPSVSGILRLDRVGGFGSVPEGSYSAAIMIERISSRISVMRGSKMRTEATTSREITQSEEPVRQAGAYEAPQIKLGGNISAVTRGLGISGTDDGNAST